MGLAEVYSKATKDNFLRGVMRNTKSWSVVNGDALDCARDVAGFLHDEFSQDGADRIWSEEYLKWKLGDENPAGSGYLSYAISEGSIVGVATLAKKRAIYNGQELVVVETGDTYTLSSIIRNGKPDQLSSLESNPNSYVNKSIFGRLVSENVHRAFLDGIQIVYGTPNNNSLPGYIKRLKFLSHVQYGNTVNYRPSAQFLVKKYPLLSPFSTIFYILESSVFSLHSWTLRFWYGRNVQISIGVPDVDEINELWASIKPSTGFSLTRDSEYWFHRYVKHPLVSYKFVGFRKNGILVAMVVVREFSYRKGRRVAAIVEHMSVQEVSVVYLLSEVLNLIKNHSIDYYYYYSSASGSALANAKKNFFFRHNPAPIVFEKSELSERICQSNDNFEFHLGSSDAV